MRRALALLAVALAGCTNHEPLSLHGAASMRVEVEVYKGPLSSPVPGQVGEMIGVLTQTIYSLRDWRSRAAVVEPTCHGASTAEECEALRSAYNTSIDLLAAACSVVNSDEVQKLKARVYLPSDECDHLKKPLVQTEGLVAALRRQKDQFQALNERGSAAATVDCGDRAVTNSREALIREFACDASAMGVSVDNLSSVLRGASRRVSDGMVARIPKQRPIRGLLIDYATMTAQYGEDLHARVSVLQKQLDPDLATDARLLPVGDYLSSTSRSDYIQLYDWLQATQPQLGPEARIMKPDDRVRMAQRLASDAYWQKVDEAYASGQGEVTMAFIKDELGNWDLKSFSNDPSDLLKAYRDVTNAAIKTAVDLTRKAATGPAGEVAGKIGNAGKAAALANQFATGEVSATPGVVAGVNISALHDRAAERISAQKVRFTALEKRLTDEEAAAAKEAEAKAGERDAAQTKLTGAENKLTAAKDTRDKAVLELSARDSALKAKQAITPPVDTTGEVEAVARATAALDLAQQGMDAAQTDVLTLKAQVAAAEKAKLEAEAKAAAAGQRLKDLHKEAIEAVRGTLDDHLAVIAALQDGIAATESPGAEERPRAPQVPVISP